MPAKTCARKSVLLAEGGAGDGDQAAESAPLAEGCAQGWRPDGPFYAVGWPSANAAQSW